MQVCLCVLKEEKGGGEGAAPPPKAECQYLFSRAMLHAKPIYLSIYLSIYMYTGKCNASMS